MTELQSISSILNDINRVIRSSRMYAANHPQVESCLRAAYVSLLESIEQHETVSLGVNDTSLLVQGQPVKDPTGGWRGLADLLRAKRIQTIRFSAGVGVSEFRDLIGLLAMKPEAALENGRIAARLTEGFAHIKLNQVRYISVSDEEEEPEGAEHPTQPKQISQSSLDVANVFNEAGVRTRQDAVRVIDAMFTSLSDDPNKSPAQKISDFLNSIQGELGQLPPDAAAKTARHYFELLALRGIAGQGVRELRDMMLQAVVSLSPAASKAILGDGNRDLSSVDVFRALRNLDPKLRSSAVVNDIMKKRLDPNQLRRAMEVLGPTPGEYVKLYEMVSRELMHSKADPGTVQDALSQFHRALRAPGGERPTRAHGNILVLDPEETMEHGYATDLQELGFTVHRFSDPKLALEHLSTTHNIQVVLLEIKLPGMSGLEVLNALVQSRKAPPVIVVTRYLQFQDAYEVSSYPKLRYLAKPASMDDLRTAIDAFLPAQAAQTQATGPKDVIPNDLKRAHEIQEKLIPASFPPLPGWDVAFFYRPAHAVGGDYLDFIRLDDHRTGIIVADVSGKNVSGAMVMVMLRSVFRMVAPACLSASETLQKVNEHVTRDIPRGMFVTAMYAILDTSNHTLQIANAGHNPPLLQTRAASLGRYIRLPGTVLGLLPGAAYAKTLREEQISFHPGDRILLYTDGVVEAMNDDGMEFGDKEFLRVVEAGATLRAPDLVRTVVEALEEHRDDAPQHDDISVVCLSRLGR